MGYIVPPPILCSCAGGIFFKYPDLKALGKIYRNNYELYVAILIFIGRIRPFIFYLETLPEKKNKSCSIYHR